VSLPGEADPNADAGMRIRPYLAAPSGAAPEPTDSPAGGDSTGAPAGLRPFVLTAGRVTGADPDIDLHTQVTRRPSPSVDGLTREQRAIVELCAEPISVAELSARLHLHLGVTKVLVGDLRAAGHLDVHSGDVETSHDPETILRVINGLRAFT
jgi:hypothetical protein